MGTPKQPEDHKPKTEKPKVTETDTGWTIIHRGITLTVEREVLDDFELLDDLAELQRSEKRGAVRVPSMLRRLALAYHESALRASLRAVYGIDLREARATMRALDLADLVVWLPAGCAFWMSVGGPAAISGETRELRRVTFWLRVLDFRERGSKGDKPKPEPEPEYAHEKREEKSLMDRKAQAFLQRQQRRG